MANPKKVSAADEATLVVAECEQSLQTARARVIAAQKRLMAARKNLASSIVQFQAGFPKRDFASVHREGIANEAKRKLAIKRGEAKPYVPVSTVGNSVLDRTAAAFAGGNARAGGGNSFRRGSGTLRVPSQR